MVDQHEHFNEGGRRALMYAEEEARSFNHHYLGTEHILLGLLRDFEGVGRRLLRRLGMDLEETRAAVETIVGRGNTPSPRSIGLTPRSKQVIELASADAKVQQQNLAGPEHLVLALLRARDDRPPGRGVAAGMLEAFGVTEERVQAELPQVLAEAEAAGEGPMALAQALAHGGKWEEAKQSLAKWREDRRRQGRRYSLVLPEDLFEEVERLAERQQTSVVELLRRFTRLGLLATQLQERPDAAL
ncbi:MAG: Clp protease N-terminal domain-containing protein, partial [Dehalococcoidia bacterium]